jgi:hypothetical protein
VPSAEPESCLTLIDLLDFAFFFFAANAGDVPKAATPTQRQANNNRANLFIESSVKNYFGNEQCAPVGALPEPAAINGGSSRWLISADLAKSHAIKVVNSNQNAMLSKDCLF